jgi:truncated hemoglobin YjbI
MTRRRNGKVLDLSRQFIADWEGRIRQQQQLISRLEKKGVSTEKAQLVLKRFESTLLELQNHSEIMQVLMKPD